MVPGCTVVALRWGLAIDQHTLRRDNTDSPDYNARFCVRPDYGAVGAVTL